MNHTNIGPEEVAEQIKGLTVGLTKENFFDEIMRIYPTACKAFCDWVDEYKKKNNWSKLFNAGYKTYEGPQPDEWIKAPKFHDLPFDMQTGLIYAFFRSLGELEVDLDPADTVEVVVAKLIEHFYWAEFRLTNKDPYPEEGEEEDE